MCVCVYVTQIHKWCGKLQTKIQEKLKVNLFSLLYLIFVLQKEKKITSICIGPYNRDHLINVSNFFFILSFNFINTKWFFTHNFNFIQLDSGINQIYWFYFTRIKCTLKGPKQCFIMWLYTFFRYKFCFNTWVKKKVKKSK